MAGEPGSDEGHVSREAHQRVVTERDQLKARIAELEPVVADLGRERMIRTALKGKVTDPDYVAEMMLPHLRDTETDKLEEALGSDRFKPMVTAFAAAGAGANGGEGGDKGGGEPTPPADPGTGFAGPGPNPGGGGAQPPADQKLAHNSPEVRAAMERGDHAWLEEQYKAGRVAEPVRKY